MKNLQTKEEVLEYLELNVYPNFSEKVKDSLKKSIDMLFRDDCMAECEIRIKPSFMNNKTKKPVFLGKVRQPLQKRLYLRIIHEERIHIEVIQTDINEYKVEEWMDKSKIA